ncbi:MAG: hypothetical protein JWO62_3266 [Acidimicrobiaceae bacterium]|jgi:hypothetical protein|nr:hypothetical protein [Acidimicrobiaceae bacterium]
MIASDSSARESSYRRPEVTVVVTPAPYAQAMSHAIRLTSIDERSLRAA